MKSSIKFCVIASGDYDFYAAEPRAHEWDIAAGHAILENAGGIITDFDGNEFMKKTHNEKINNEIIKKFAPKVVEGVIKLKNWSTT